MAVGKSDGMKMTASRLGDQMEGLIRKGVGGFYYVEAAGALYECKARGIFRKEGVIPLAGDWVDISLKPDGTGSIDRIHPRLNALVRPPVANIDRLLIVASLCDPAPNRLVIDKMIASAEDKEIDPILVISKTDLADAGELEAVYRMAGIRTVRFSSVSGEGAEVLRDLLANGVSAFTGNSGAGKSSLLNRLFPAFDLPTGEISRKLGRGRHTTREVELLPLPTGGYVVDTPGFSSLDVEQIARIRKENLPFCFREFLPYLGQCRFSSCAHLCEKGCAVLAAVQEGKIHPSRHESYRLMYKELKNIEERQYK